METKPKRLSPEDSSNPTLSSYLQQISRLPLLTREEEIRLAKLSLGKDKKKSEEAQQKLVEHNLRLVVRIAKGYQGLGLDLMDLISEGNIGLREAAERFNPKFEAKFSTYAAFWIKQKIRRSISNQGRTIRIPVHQNDKMNKVHRAINLLSQQLGRDPSPEEISEETGLPLKSIQKTLEFNIQLLPLDSPQSADDPSSNTIGEAFADEKAVHPGELTELTNLKESLAQILPTLPERERYIIEARFGFQTDGEKRTLEDVGRKFHITRERIRQLQNIALQKLKRALEKLDRPQQEQFI